MKLTNLLPLLVASLILTSLSVTAPDGLTRSVIKWVKYNALHAYHRVQLTKYVLVMEISQAISRTAGPNIGLLVLILMHFQ